MLSFWVLEPLMLFTRYPFMPHFSAKYFFQYVLMKNLLREFVIWCHADTIKPSFFVDTLTSVKSHYLLEGISIRYFQIKI